ncbi:MAG: LysR family transcriptional regulator [Lachnospiraceae bacterium]|nr:LysR family transcriptional regulator [Lachnospiraceae bacterium]
MEEINMREIEVFLAVARNQNISKAAQELYISQSALSSWISRMEEYCGISLFRRTNRGVVLTPEGEQLYGRLDIDYNRFRIAVEEICGTYKNRSSDTLRIGCLGRLAVMDVFREKQKLFSEQYPEREVKAERFNFHELRDRVLCRGLDLIITLSTDIEPYKEFESCPIGIFPQYFIVEKNIKDLSELNGQPLIIEAPTSREGAERICKEKGIIPGGIKYVNSYILVTSLAAAGEGFAIDGKMVPDKVYFPETRLIPVDPSEDVKIVLAWNKEWVSDPAKEFISFCRSADL